MPNVDLSFAQDPNTLSLAILYGMVPALIWVRFWLRENIERKRRMGLLTALFLGGAGMVIATLPVQQFIAHLSTDDNVLNVLWAASEEVLKFGIFALIVLRASGKNIQNPIDYPIYIIIAALGFAGFENALYFLGPLQTGSPTAIALAGSMRFLGTTLLHAASSSLVGIALGFAYFKSKQTSILYAFLGLIAAVSLHSTFNYFIVQNDQQNFFQVFGFLWIATVIIMVLLEKLRRMGSIENRHKKEVAFFAHIDELFATVLAAASATPSDGVPLTDMMKIKTLPENGMEFSKLKTLIGSLRALYAAYLESTGTPHATAPTVAATMVPENISAKQAAGVISMLRGEIEHEIANVAAEEKAATAPAPSMPNTAARG